MQLVTLIQFFIINTCYNFGEISDNFNDSEKTGGIAARLDTNTTIKSCYTATKGSLVQNSYYWNNPSTISLSLGEECDTLADMKTQEFCDKLNSTDPTKPIYKMIQEQEFPALYWQEGTPK